MLDENAEVVAAGKDHAQGKSILRNQCGQRVEDTQGIRLHSIRIVDDNHGRFTHAGPAHGKNIDHSQQALDGIITHRVAELSKYCCQKIVCALARALNVSCSGLTGDLRAKPSYGRGLACAARAEKQRHAVGIAHGLLEVGQRIAVGTIGENGARGRPRAKGPLDHRC